MSPCCIQGSYMDVVKLIPGVTVYLVPAGILSPCTHFPPKVSPLKFISYLFVFYNFYSATYFIALKLIFCVKMNGQNTNRSRLSTRAF